MSVPIDPRSSLHIARQPIFEGNQRVFGYELLYRTRANDRVCTTSGDLAASRVITDAILSIGLEGLVGGSKAFINFTRPLLLNGAASLLPPEAVVIELREDIAVDENVVEACRDLQKRGYTMALDDFVAGSSAEALVPYVSIVKLDVLDQPVTVWQPVAQRFASNGLRVVAERVENVAVVGQAREAGCTLFQGYYFCRPVTQSVRTIPARRLAYLNLFAALSRPDLTIDGLEDLIARDLSLTVRVMQSVNSAAFAIGREISSLRHALVLLGLQQVQRWASVWAMAGVNSGGTPEMVAVSLLRARTCEAVGEAWGGTDASGELFLLGMCSMLDAILDQPMEKAIANLPLTNRVRGALMGDTNELRSILDATLAHEQGDWDEAMGILERLGVSEIHLSTAYYDALRWARELSVETAAA